jgi:hypothetical protein
MVLTPGTAGDVLKWNSIVALLFNNWKLSAGIPFTVRSLGWTLVGSTGSFRLTVKSVGGVKTTLPQVGLVTEQGVGVGD